MLFCSLDGSSEEQEGDSPSFFNRHEATTILALVKSLLSSCADAIAEDEVGHNNNNSVPRISYNNNRRSSIPRSQRCPNPAALHLARVAAARACQ